MLAVNNHHSDTTLSPQPVHYNESEWLNLYDEYAPMMYGTILKMTGDESLADIVLEEVFLDLYKKKILFPQHTPLRLSILRHTFKWTSKYLEGSGLPIQQPFKENYGLINQFYFEQKALKDVANNLQISEQEVSKKLRAEFIHFSQNNA